ncbi:MAG TPA: hypothetical protein VN841_11900 [Bryobacteraceae bacterium]|nr:hypothetical protein [Bryobacteraceae bacterium]
MRIAQLAIAASAVFGSVLAQVPQIAAGGVIDAAGFTKGQAIAPGSLVSIFGSGLSSALAQGDTVPLSIALNGTSVSFNGVLAGLDFVSGGQINAQVPWNVVSSGTVNVVVTTPQGGSVPIAVPVAQFSPGIFSIPPGAGYAVAINADGSIAAPAGAIAGFPTHPAKIGDALVVYANGLGPVDIPVANGAASTDALRHTTTTPVVLIGGKSAQVLFSGLTPQFPGVNQLNVVVPQVTLGNSVSIQLQEGGITTSSQVVIALGN